MNRAEKRRNEREPYTAEDLANVNNAYKIFTYALQKAFDKVDISEGKRQSLLTEMKYVMDELSGKDPEKIRDYLKLAKTPHKPSKRLNFNERREYMQMNVVSSCIISFADEFTQRGILTNQEKGWLKMAYTYIMKVMVGVASRLDRDEKAKQEQLMKKYEFCILNKADDKQKIMQAADEWDTVKMSREQFCEFAKYKAIPEHCTGCMKDYGGCELYRAQYEIGVEPIEFYEDGCPYRYPAQAKE